MTPPRQKQIVGARLRFAAAIAAATILSGILTGCQTKQRSVQHVEQFRYGTSPPPTVLANETTIVKVAPPIRYKSFTGTTTQYKKAKAYTSPTFTPEKFPSVAIQCEVNGEEMDAGESGDKKHLRAITSDIEGNAKFVLMKKGYAVLDRRNIEIAINEKDVFGNDSASTGESQDDGKSSRASAILKFKVTVSFQRFPQVREFSHNYKYIAGYTTVREGGGRVGNIQIPVVVRQVPDERTRKVYVTRLPYSDFSLNVAAVLLDNTTSAELWSSNEQIPMPPKQNPQIRSGEPQDYTIQVTSRSQSVELNKCLTHILRALPNRTPARQTTGTTP